MFKVRWWVNWALIQPSRDGDQDELGIGDLEEYNIILPHHTLDTPDNKIAEEVELLTKGRMQPIEPCATLEKEFVLLTVIDSLVCAELQKDSHLFQY